MPERSVTIRAIQAQRESVVWLGEERTQSVTIRRPPEGELWMLGRGIELEHLVRYTVGWSGFTEADVIQGGASDELEFHADLFREVLIDRADWITLIANAIAQAVKAHTDKRQAASGN